MAGFKPFSRTDHWLLIMIWPDRHIVRPEWQRHNPTSLKGYAGRWVKARHRQMRIRQRNGCCDFRRNSNSDPHAVWRRSPRHQMATSQRRTVAAGRTVNDIDDIEVKRKIERGKGSSYTVNANQPRARDIQLLFADTATGAAPQVSSVRAGSGAIVGAKPVDRQVLIEEAANIRATCPPA